MRESLGFGEGGCLDLMHIFAAGSTNIEGSLLWL